MDGVYD
jgi:hypothetical protein